MESPDHIGKVIVSRMSLDYKILMHVIVYCITHKSGSHTTPNELENYLMFYLLEGIEVNIPYMLIRRMGKCCQKDGTPLAYASLVTMILQFHSISPFYVEEVTPKAVDQLCIARMGHVLINNEWTSKFGTIPFNLLHLIILLVYDLLFAYGSMCIS
jgi:hypothetical protein